MITDEQVRTVLKVFYPRAYAPCDEEIELMRKALEAYEQSKPKYEPEPVAWIVWNGWTPVSVTLSEEKAKSYAQGRQLHSDLSGDFNAYRVAPLYTTPPTREPLSETIIECIGYKYGLGTLEGSIEFTWYNDETVDFAREIEQAHGIGVTND